MSHQHVNNPFAPQPQTSVEATASRFPDVSGELQQSQQQQQYYQQQQQQPQQFSTAYSGGYAQQQPLQSQYTGFQPSSSFGQQLHYEQQQQQYGSMSNGPSPQVSFSNSDLDPYSGLSQLGQTSGGGGSMHTAGNRVAPAGLMNVQQTQSHPRQYVHDNKSLLMTWDDYAWKQLLGRVDSLRQGWEQRKSSISTLGNQGADPTLVESLKRDADNYIDSCHAAKMQLAEVKEGWRHSTDAASKARVREALNAGLASLPEYPPALTPEQLGGAFYQRAYEDHRKQSIMSSFNTGPQQQPQQTGYGQQQPQHFGSGGVMSQPTGFAGGMGMSMQPQQTGYYQQTGYMHSQPTGYGGFAQQQTGYQGGGTFGGQQGFGGGQGFYR
ncbi:hypothetical protein OIV83_002306 [Microbotryomycetes sp. JL201]|nr:hypothetical protein OIV83_002306 [Microbotryomycetes sp. JL201]